VLVVTPVPPLATGNVPVTPVVRGRPVTLVITPALGVPRFGVVRLRLAANIVLVTVAVSPEVIMLPVTAGTVMV